MGKVLKLDVSELQKFREEQYVIYAKCSVTGKVMLLTLSGKILILQNGKLIREFIKPLDAVKFFNEL